ncbi:Coiled-coil domain-containing protein 65 [Fasciolopsis buskii]|uniref:Dynein regulatory complex subunit 2 n=1 Tax=Fasciolopsis buskii TaxID=27845 RepID=A0A8E0VN09_9TREM|nr:Coiled-coil domain-containing protein 65 [Fasciolopsis buski]
MPKKKKDKFANMTEEEKAAYLEQQRLAEEEAKARKTAMLTKYLQDKLEKEEKVTRMNQFKLIHHWRAIMREAKSTELKKDIDILSQTFERIIDRKDSIIKTLIKDLNEAEEQHMMSLRFHMDNVDRLIELQNDRLKKLRLDYETELQMLTREFGQEEEFLIAQHNKQLDDLKDIFVALDSTYTAKEADAKTEHHSMKDELKNRNLEDKHALRISLETKVNHLWSDFKTALNQYNKVTDEKISFFENLKAKDEKSAMEIEMQMRKLQRVAEHIAICKRRMARVSKEFEEKNKHLKDEREKLVGHFQDLKTQLSKLRESQHEKLVKMSLESGAATKRVQKLLGKAEKIIKLAEQCRKYETEEEKVVPFYLSSLTEEEEEAVNGAFHVEGDEELSAILRRCAPLEMFWRRFNKVQLDRLAINKERDLLRQENMQLRSLLKQYLDGISVNDEVLAGNNSLFVLNGRSNLNPQNIADDPRINRISRANVELTAVISVSRHENTTA